MKRLLGTIGLTYLTVSAAAFFLPETAVFLLAAGLSAAVCGLILTVRKTEKGKTVLISGLSAVMALLCLFLYQNYIFQPVINNYSDKEIYFKGYICDEILIGGKTTVVPVQTEEIDGEKADVRINLTVYGYLDAEEFDCVEGRLFAAANKSKHLLSTRLCLSASEGEGLELSSTG